MNTTTKALIVSVFCSLFYAVSIAHAARTLEVHGHRGARGLAPENTLVGFTKALGLRVTALELDVGVSRDGVVVVSHDQNLAPYLTRDDSGEWLADAGISIRSLTLAEIQRYDVGTIKPGTRYAKRFPEQKAKPATPIPTLAAVFELVQAANDKTITFNIETKINPDRPALAPAPAAFAKSVLTVIDEFDLRDRVIMQSFDWRTLREVKRQAPEIRTAHLTAEQDWLDNIKRGGHGASSWLGGTDVDDFDGDVPGAIKAFGGDIWSPYYGDISPGDVERAHSLGIDVLVWTVNDTETMRKMIEFGVDGIITDYPDRLVKLLRTLGIAVQH